MERPLYSTATEALANEITFRRGDATDILAVKVYHNINPNTIPTLVNFTEVDLIVGTDVPTPDLAEGTKIDILSLIGTKVGAHLSLAAGDWQRWALVQTAAEDIIIKLDVIEVL